MSEYSPNNPAENQGAESEMQDSQRLLGWSALLAKWTEFAQASVALPKDQDGPRWKASVAPVIAMQAMIAALNELDQLPAGRRPVAIDAAETMLREQLAIIHEAWSGELIPESIQELIEESRQAIFDARHLGVEWRVIEERVEAPDLAPIAAMLLEAGFTGDLHAARAGTTLFCGAPVAFFRPPMDANPPAGCGAFVVVGPRQCYRQLDDETKQPLRDVVAGPEAELQPGMPLLAPLIVDGAAAPVIPGCAPIAVDEPLPVVELD